jgi:glycosyltransferase involved in cell wall biosynthesis
MKVCLVGHSVEGLLSASVGGSERQIALLARTLAARGHDVALVVTDLGGGEREIDGVRVRAGWEAGRGVRYVRAVMYRYPRLWRVLRDERADVYYARGAGYYTPFVVGAARAAKAVSILALASDRDLDVSASSVLFAVGGSRLSPLVARLGHRVYRDWAARRATWVAVQNRDQAAACAALGLRVADLPNIVVPPPANLRRLKPTGDVVWVGNVFEGRRSKGLETLAVLAGALPEVAFTVVGALEAGDAGPTVRTLRELPNVELTGALSHADTQRRLARSRLVLNTSPSEGFSNVMLEGWSLGRPSVTLCVDPDGLLSEQGLGVCAGGDVLCMAKAVKGLLADDARRDEMAARCRAYVAGRHGAEGVAQAFEALAAAPR